MGTRTVTLVAIIVMASLGASFAGAQGFRTATGSNPLEQVSGPDYAGRQPATSFATQLPAINNFQVPPNYTARYGLQQVTGGVSPYSQSFYLPQLGGNGVDPRTGVSISAGLSNPFLSPYYNPTVAPLPFSGYPLGYGMGYPTMTPVNNASLSIASANNASVGTMVNNGTGYMMPTNMPVTANGAMYPYPVPGISTNNASTMINSVNNASMGTMVKNGLGNGVVATGQPIGSSTLLLPGTNYGGAYNASTAYLGSYPSGTYGGSYGAVSTPYVGAGYGGGPAPGQTIVPGLITGIVGAVIGARFGGAIGAVLGGIGGYLVGSMIARHLYTPAYSSYYDNMNNMLDQQYASQMSYQQGYYQYYYGNSYSPITSLLPGIAGAVLGAAIGSHAGITGVLVGGVVGFFAGKLLGSILFPQLFYNQYGLGYTYPDPYNNINGFRNGTLPGTLRSGTNASGSSAASGTSGAGGTVVRPSAPTAPSSTSDLVALRNAFYSKLDAFQKAAASGDSNAAGTARAAYEAARDAYLKARGLAIGAASPGASGATH